jgi:anaerobic magnesium-protoporphyrin IX monomethyl ester cyclase
MRVLFVHPPHTGFDRDKSPKLTFSVSRIPPLSGITLAAYLRKHGHEPYVIDGNRITQQFGNVREQTYEEIVRQALKFRPELIAVTMLTADFAECAETIRVLRSALPKATIVGGGPHPSGEPVVTLEQIPELDGIGLGPGEDICLDLASGRPISETPGCAYLRDGQVVFVGKRKVDTYIDAIPFPAWDLIDGHYYSELNIATTFGLLTRSLGVLTSRGCPGNCYFCSSKWNRPLRVHSAEYVLDFCEHLANSYPIDTIAFWDDTMGISPKRLVKICEGFLERGLHRRVQWQAHLRADQIEPGLLKLMKGAGCFYVAFGVESGSDRILELLNKGITVSQNLAAAELVNQAGLFLGISVILGTPGETEEEMKETIEFCKQITCASIGMGRFCPLPGSPSYTDLVKSGKINPRQADWELLGNFSLLDGPCFADIDPRRFRQILSDFRAYCYRKDRESCIRNNLTRYPEIVKLYQRSMPSARGKSSYAKRVLKRLVPRSIRQFLREMLLDRP